MIECEIATVFNPQPMGQGFSFKANGNMDDFKEKFYNDKYGTYSTSLYTGGTPCPAWVNKGTKFRANFKISDKGYLVFKGQPEIIYDASLRDDITPENDGTDFDPEEYEQAQKDVPLINEDGEELELLDEKEVKLREEVSKLLKFEAWKQDQIHNNLAKFEWFMNYPPEERQKFEIAEYIESNIQIHNRWRKG